MINVQNEIKYGACVSTLKRLLALGYITEEEYDIAQNYVANTYYPLAGAVAQ